MKFSKLREKKWSLRSQASYERESKLREQLFNILRGLAYDQKRLDEAQAALDAQVKAASLGSANAAGSVTQSLARVKEQKDRIEVFGLQRQNIQAQIDAVAKVSPSEAKARAEHQTALAKLTIERLAIDRSLADVVRMAQGLLEKRSKMSGEMLGLLRKIDFTLAFDGLDRDRFEALQKCLPADLESRSEAWVRWLLEEDQKAERYTVLDETVVFAETLANANSYRRGEQVDLSAEQFAEVTSIRSSADYPLRPVPEEMEVRNPRVEKCAEAGK